MGLCHSCFSPPAHEQNDPDEQNDPVPVLGGPNNGVHVFTFGELMIATENFKPDNFLGEGGFGKVYKGHLARLNQDVAVKQLDLQSSTQGHEEFVSEVMALSLADHPNLVKLIGYCIEGNQHLIVYEYMPLKSLDYHLHDLEPNSEALDWNTRMRIAADAIQGLKYIHTTMNPKLIHRDLKSSNILLGENYHAKLSDFGLVKIAPTGDNTHVSTRVMGTLGYCAPEYALTGHLTTRSDIYSFGVILLEIITGRQALDSSKPSSEKYLVEWATHMFKHRTNFPKMVDPLLKGRFPRSGFLRALSIAAICIQENPESRPEIGGLVQSLVFLASQPYPRPRISSSSTAHIDQPSTSSSSTAQIYQPSTNRSSTVQIDQPNTNRSSTAQIDQPRTSSSSTTQIDQPSTSSSSTTQIDQPSSSSENQPSSNR